LHLAEQDPVTAQHRQVPAAALLAEYISELSLQVAQIFALADPQSVGQILNPPSIFPGFVLFILAEVGSERALHKPGFRYHHLPAIPSPKLN